MEERLYLKKYYLQFPERRLLRDIKQRCTNPNNKSYKTYGGRGIKCLITAEEIKKLMIRDNYKSFKDPTIDRIDNDGNYCLENCRFIERGLNAQKDSQRTIVQYDLQGNFIKEWKSGSEVERQLKISQGHISKVVNNIRKSIGGYVWKYKENQNGKK